MINGSPNQTKMKETSFRRNWKKFSAFYRRFARNRGSLVGLGMLLTIFILGWGIPLITRVDAMKMVGDAFRSPSGTYLFGTDDVGRNVFHQVVVGAQTSVMVGLIAAAFSTIIGLIVGSVSGHYGRWLDAFLMRGTELFMVIPRGFLALVLVAILGASIWNIIFAIGVLSWPSTARLVRSEFLKFKHSEFVDAARASGAPERRIMVYEILPNAFPTIIVNTALEVGAAILLEAGISFLGLGDPQQMSWGVMLFQAQIFMRRAPWMTIFPGLGIFLTVMGLNLFADGLNEALNPKFRRIIKLKAEA
jgi:peptide/nickel transport system permease protein